MPKCTMIIDERGGKCGRVAGVQRVKVRGPGFRLAEHRMACDRCRGEEVTLVVPPVTRPSRPQCTACARFGAVATGLCHRCTNGVNCHIKEFSPRLPRPGTVAYKALHVINIEATVKFKHHKEIVRMKAELLREVA